MPTADASDRPVDSSDPAGQSGPADPTEQLARRAATGDRAALEELLVAIGPDVLRRCNRFLPYRQDAEEAAQDTLLAVARHITSFAGRSKFSTWLYEVTANCCRGTYRKLKRRAVEQLSYDGAPERVDPARTSVLAGSRVDLLEALDRLEEHRRDLLEPVVLRDVAGLEYAEIAQRLGIPLGTVKSRIHDARRLLQSWLVVRG